MSRHHNLTGFTNYNKIWVKSSKAESSKLIRKEDALPDHLKRIKGLDPTMTKNRFFILLILLLLQVLLFSGCASHADPVSESNEPSGETESTIVNESETEASTMFDLTDIVITRPDLCGDNLTRASVTLKKAIESMCGIKVGIRTDYDDSDHDKKQILLGNCKLYTECESALSELSDEEYSIKVTGNKIVIVGKTETDTIYAMEQFMASSLSYSADKYQNEPIGKAEVAVFECTKARNQTKLDSGRVVKLADSVWSDPIPYSEFGASSDAQCLHFKDTGSMKWNDSIEDTSFRVEFTATNKGDNQPIVQLFVYFAGSEHICIGIQNHFVRFGRGTYERGGATFSGNANRYTFRIEVFPDVGMARYYMNNVFLGEMNTGDADAPLTRSSGVALACVGNNMDVDITDIYIEEIDDVEPRQYKDPGIKVDPENIYPKSDNPPAETIYVIDSNGLNADERLTLLTLQGLVNRTTPRIFFDYRNYNQDTRYMNIPEEEAFLNILKSKGRTLVNATLEELLIKFKNEYKGIIYGNAFATNYGENVATSLCGIMDAIYLNPSQYGVYKDQIQKNVLFRIDNRWKSDIDAYMWVWKEYGNLFNDSLLFYTPANAQCSGHLAEACRDYAVMTRSFAFCTTGVETLEDYDFYMGIMASRAANSPIIGFANVGCFPEFEMFQVAGQLAKYWTYGFSCANMSLLNSLEFGELKQKTLPSPVTVAKPGTVYVAFDISEGDNLSWDYHMWAHMYKDEAARAATPKAFSLCGAMYYVAPALIEYYYEHATLQDYFFLDGASVSNIGSPDNYASYFVGDEREKILDGMLEALEYVASHTDIPIVRALSAISDEMTKRIGESCPTITALLSSYGNNTIMIGGSGSNYANSIYMVDDIVRSKCFLTTFENDLTGRLRTLYSQAKGASNPVFAKVFVYCNQILDDVSKMSTYKEALEATGYQIVYLRLDEYVNLFRNSQ